MTDCGAARESCCTSLHVAGGTFYRLYTNDGTGPTREAVSDTVSSFRLDKYDVTVGRFRQFVGAWNGGAGWVPPEGAGKHMHANGGRGLRDFFSADLPPSVSDYESGWSTIDNSQIAPTDVNLAPASPMPTPPPQLACDQGLSTWTSSTGKNETLPINCINWFEAYAFCIWDGGFLPSATELAYASAGGDEQREYPWGTTPPGTANQFAIYGYHYGSGLLNQAGLANIAPVGTATLGAGLWGQLDLVGELQMWTMDAFEIELYSFRMEGDHCTDCYNRHSFAMAVVGSAFSSSSLGWVGGPGSETIRLARHPEIGFRCARAP
jgi:sulfatase modifying factor 1